EGYFKKITPQSLRGNDEQKFKENDQLLAEFETDNRAELLLVTDKAQIYRLKVDDFDCVKASSMGDFLPAKLGMEDGEKPVLAKLHNGFPQGENFVFLFENGKGVRIPLSSYETKSVRRRLTGVYSTASPLVAAFHEVEKHPFEIMMVSDAERAIILKSSLIPVKTTRTSSGVTVMTLKKGQKLATATNRIDEAYENAKGYRKLKIPATGVLLADKDLSALQLKITE
ncbi:MAG: topoisomerase IV, partial [Clostridia bacterium]|nr:topoisomerase IV [Clostridia bacterium]